LTNAALYALYTITNSVSSSSASYFLIPTLEEHCHEALRGDGQDDDDSGNRRHRQLLHRANAVRLILSLHRNRRYIGRHAEAICLAFLVNNASEVLSSQEAIDQLIEEPALLTALFALAAKGEVDKVGQEGEEKEGVSEWDAVETLKAEIEGGGAREEAGELSPCGGDYAWLICQQRHFLSRGQIEVIGRRLDKDGFFEPAENHYSGKYTKEEYKKLSEKQVIDMLTEAMGSPLDSITEEAALFSALRKLCTLLARRRVFGPRLMAESHVPHGAEYVNLPIAGLLYIEGGRAGWD
jgi:hypothetical protein